MNILDDEKFIAWVKEIKLFTSQVLSKRQLYLMYCDKLKNERKRS